MEKTMKHKQSLIHQKPRVYLAGPDVFLRNPLHMGELKKALCNENGLEGVFPYDAEVETVNGSRKETGLKISAANEKLIRSCQAIIANITPFRGISADVGTVYEMGFARAIGLKVFAYTNVKTTFTQRNIAVFGNKLMRDENGYLRDENDMGVEEWELMDNLMLEGGIYASGGRLIVEEAPVDQVFTYLGGFEKCLVHVRKALK
jgi:nucleoside 2-deoxyribosyltransferase